MSDSVEEFEDFEQEIHSQIEYATPAPYLKPIYLLADSQLLFWKRDGGVPFLHSVRSLLKTPDPLAVYIGASNGDDPAYYAIFEAAMVEAGIRERRMIPSALDHPDDLDSVDRAHLILLAGGDVEQGWKVFKENGLNRILARRYQEGALLMGISAGAVQLGLGGWSSSAPEKRVDTLRLLPHVVGAHEEAEQWAPLKRAVKEFGGHVRGYGLPFGSGMAYHSDHSVEPLRKPILEFQLRRGQVEAMTLLPREIDAESVN